MLTCCTALTMPRRVANSTVRSLTSSSGCAVIILPSRPSLRIYDIAQAVAEQVEAEYRDHQRKPGKQRDPPFARDHEAGAFRHHDAPLRCRRPHPETDERQSGSIEDRIAHGQR